MKNSQGLEPVGNKNGMVCNVEEIRGEGGKSKEMEITKYEVSVLVRDWLDLRASILCGRDAYDCTGLSELRAGDYAEERIASFLKTGMITAKKVNQIGKGIFTRLGIYDKYWTDWKEPEDEGK